MLVALKYLNSNYIAKKMRQNFLQSTFKKLPIRPGTEEAGVTRANKGIFYSKRYKTTIYNRTIQT